MIEFYGVQNVLILFYLLNAIVGIVSTFVSLDDSDSKVLVKGNLLAQLVIVCITMVLVIFNVEDIYLFYTMAIASVCSIITCAISVVYQRVPLLKKFAKTKIM